MDFRDYSHGKSLYPVKLLAKLDRGDSAQEIRNKTGLSIGQPGWGLLYYLVQVSHLKEEPGTIVETGSNFGLTTICLAQALVDAGVRSPRVLSFELNPDNVNKAKKMAKKAGLEEVITIIEGDTGQTLAPTLLKELEFRSVGFAFLDASHLAKDVRNEFENLLPYLRDDALVVFDNTYPIDEAPEEPRVGAFIQELEDIYGGSVIEFPFVSWFTPGLAIWQKNRPNWIQVEHFGSGLRD